jgi:hypothetical protein
MPREHPIPREMFAGSLDYLEGRCSKVGGWEQANQPLPWGSLGWPYEYSVWSRRTVSVAMCVLR